MRGRIAASRGFTLAEMLIVVAAIAAIAAVAVPLLTSPSPQRVELAAMQLTQALRFARSAAEATGEPHGLRIDTTADRVQVFRLDTSTMPPTHDFDVYHPMTRLLYMHDFPTAAATRGVQISAAALSFTGSCSEPTEVAFDERGTPLCANPLSAGLSSAAIDLSDGRSTRRVTVAAISGRTVLQ